MAEYLDNIFTDEDLSSKEFLDVINEELSDITGYVKKEEKGEKNKDNEDAVDPLLEVIKKEEVKIIDVTKTIINELTNDEKVKILRKPRSKASIAIDESGDIICKSWGNYYISGTNDSVETAELINEYLKECEKPISGRNLSKFIVGKKNILEKFADMNLHKGKFDINGFFENVV